jgi:subtilisin family serine protease
MCERLAKAGRQVIAAAGNGAHDAGRSRKAPDARYPAAFERVVGVGALPKNAERSPGKYNASSYSNLADKPPQTGVMALGGEPGAENGVLGIYLGNFPEIVVDDDDDATTNESGWDKRGPRSKNGWAWWAGTSFATPILTGAIAAVLGSLPNQRSTQKAVHELYESSIITDDGTDASEDVMKESLVQDVKPAP